MAGRFGRTNEKVWTAAELIQLSLQKHKLGKYLLEANVETIRASDTDISDENAKWDPLRTANSYIFPTIEKLGRQGLIAVAPRFTEIFCDFYAQRGQYAPVDANETLLLETLQAESLPLTLENLLYVAGMPSVQERLATTGAYQQQQRVAVADQKQAVEAEGYRTEMLSWFATAKKHLYPNKYVWADILETETKRLNALTPPQVCEEFSRRQSVRAAKAMDPKDYRAFVAESRKQAEVYAQAQAAATPAAPSTVLTYTTRDGITFDLTRDTLLAAARRNPPLFREICRVKGTNVIDGILNAGGN